MTPIDMKVKDMKRPIALWVTNDKGTNCKIIDWDKRFKLDYDPFFQVINLHANGINSIFINVSRYTIVNLM